jgi:SNF2 family DNA or RNA helicase
MEYVTLDNTSKEIIITNIAIDRLLRRIKEAYSATSEYNTDQIRKSNILNIFDSVEYITWDKTEIKFKSFFAIEVYDIFHDLGTDYKDDIYLEVADELYRKTWISNYETKDKVKTDTSKLIMFNYEPKDFQLDFIKNYQSLKFEYDLDGYILSFEQGLGKTFTAIALAECLNKEAVYIVCPNSIKENWAQEIQKYYKKYEDKNLWKQEVFVLNVPKYKYTKNTKFFIINQESIPDLFQYVKPNKNSMIIIDESQYFRGLHTNRTEAMLQLKEIAACHDNLLMSGTPVKASPSELVPALRMIDPNFTPELAEVYSATFTSKSPNISSIVKERFRRVIYRKLKKDTIKLPEKYISELRMKIPNPDEFSMHALNKKILMDYHIDYLNRLKTGLFTNNKLSVFYRSSTPARYSFIHDKDEFEKLVRTYSRANTGKTEEYLNYIFQKTEDIGWELINPRNVDEKYFWFLNKMVLPYVDNPDDEYILTKKFDGIYGWSIAAKGATGTSIGKNIADSKNKCFKLIWDYNNQEIINMINKCKKKTVIFTALVPIADYIATDLKKKGIGTIEITGANSNRMDLVDKFKNDSSIKVLIATTETLANGVTLTEASQMFFFGTPYRSADFDQACDRIHRIGQDSPVYIYNVLLWSHDKNITNRIEEILNWSEEMFDSIMTEETNTYEKELTKILETYKKR